jgi:hypothetical protein
VRPGVGVQEDRQVAGAQPAPAERGEDGEAVVMHELVQLGRVGLGEGGGTYTLWAPGPKAARQGVRGSSPLDRPGL